MGKEEYSITHHSFFESERMTFSKCNKSINLINPQLGLDPKVATSLLCYVFELCVWDYISAHLEKNNRFVIFSCHAIHYYIWRLVRGHDGTEHHSDYRHTD